MFTQNKQISFWLKYIMLRYLSSAESDKLVKSFVIFINVTHPTEYNINDFEFNLL